MVFFPALTQTLPIANSHDPIAMDTIRSRDLLVWHYTNFFSDFCWCYFNIVLLVALHLFCYFLNPICTFIVFYIFLLYSGLELSSFFPYPVLFSLHVTFHPTADRTLTGCIGTACFANIVLLCSYIALERKVLL